MQTFNLTCEFDLKAVVPEQFLKSMREAAQAEDATEFLQRVQADTAEDDDEFVLALLRHALRRIVGNAVLQEFQAVGVGGTFSPAKVRDRTPPVGVEPVLATEVLPDMRHAVPA